MSTSLITIQRRVANRVDAILAGHHWPCRRGCDHCCRHLAAPPTLTAAEWEQLQPALASLPASVHRRIQNLDAAAPVTCPLLDLNSSACLVYEQRPVACRTYGFFVERDQGLYCGIILHRVAQGELNGVTWGNAQAIADDLAPLGPARSLCDWYREKFLCPPLS